MNQPKVRRYIDKSNGKMRTLELHEEPGFFVKWHKLLPESMVSRWRAEDGSIIQIPDASWLDHGSIWEAPKEIKPSENN